jgi:serine/threonine protein kinase/WD40 repeat protein
VRNTTETHPDEAVLAQFVAELDAAADVAAVVGDYAARHPHLAGQLAEVAQLVGKLDDLYARPASSKPARFGEFRIVRELPGGGMGRIYEAIQEPLGRRVAVKTIRSERLSPQMRERFLREQTVLGALHQTHIVPIHTAGQTGDFHYFAMPFIEGVTLNEITQAVRRRDGRLSNPPSTGFAALVSQCLELLHGTGRETPDSHRRTRPPSNPIGLSIEYFRSVAAVLRDAAQACHHVHGLQILHRDLKPSNIMVDTAGECWIIDFGLAALIEAEGRSSEASDASRLDATSEQLRRRLTVEGAGSPGTPAYIAPEQWRKERVDARTDVWGLGVTLYELLTLRPAFSGATLEEIRRKILTEDPPAPRQLVQGVPADLAAVCRKAMRKNPDNRYRTASEFAADLARWLRHEPVSARPSRVPRRVWLWCRRNRGWAAAITFLALGSGGLAVMQIQAERERAASLQVRELSQRRERLLERMQNLRLLPHLATPNANWFDEGWDLVRQAGEIRRDETLQDQAAAFLAGMNGRLSKFRLGFEGSSVAFDADGQRALIGGNDNDEARIWNARTDRTQKSGMAGSGPVAFRADGTACQLVATEKNRLPLLLWDAGRRRLIRKLIPAPGGKQRAGDEARVTSLFLAPEGAFAAAIAAGSDGAAELTVWSTERGDVVRQIRQNGRQPSAIAVSDDGRLLAAGDREGRLAVWSLPDGESLSPPTARRSSIKCLAFGRNVQVRSLADLRSNWLLAGGDAGGTVTVWDLGKNAPLSYCRGSIYDVNALAFSPDGATLASAGHDSPRLWDTATGRELLHLGPGSHVTGLAFTRDTSKLAASTAPGVGEDPHRPGFWLWELQAHRGLQTLRGLTSEIPPTKVCLSRDGLRVAALSLDWRAAIWDLPSGRLQHLFDVTPGITADNSGIAISPDGRSFAVAAGSEARMWELETGKCVTWQLPPGLLDTLFFDVTGKRLFLFRMESADSSEVPDRAPFLGRVPQIGRMRDLLASDLRRTGRTSPAWESRFFRARIFQTAVTDDGRFILVCGESETFGQGGTLKGFECASGREVFSTPSPGNFQFDGERGLIVNRSNQNGPEALTFIEFPSGKIFGSIDRAGAPSPGARLFCVTKSSGYGNAIFRKGDDRPLVTLGIDNQCTSHGVFSRDGARLAWGNQDGTVTVCHLEEIQRRMAAIGIGW